MGDEATDRGTRPATAGLSPDGMYYWSGSAWLSATSADGLWRWDGTNWIATGSLPRRSPSPISRARLWGRTLQVLLGLWIAAVAVELFVAFIFFALTLTAPDGTAVTYRWGIASSLLQGAILCISFVWFWPIRREAIRALRRSRRLRTMTLAWASMFIAYVASDVAIAEAVRGVAIDGPETRWHVLVSAAVGIATAAVAIGWVGRITSAVCCVLANEQEVAR